MSISEHASETLDDFRNQWRSVVARYQRPSHLRSTWQLVNTIIPYFLLLGLMYWSLDYSYWITLALAVPAAGLLVRIFIISHDCGHGAFFRSRKANDIVGGLTSFMCLTPYYYWKHEHALHHASAGNLDKRGHGDIWTMTVKEYLASSWKKKLAYRLYRNPVILFGIGAFSVFMIEYRIPPFRGTLRNRLSVWRTNAGVVAVMLVCTYTIGLQPLFMIQLPIFFIAAAAGSWLFYVQHQFEGVYWERDKEWDYFSGCVEGSSCYRLPKVLQWFTGNIGYHHVHHLSSKIPNYYLEDCHRENPPLQQAHQLTLWSSLKCLNYRLWDDENRSLLTFGDLRSYRKAQAEKERSQAA
ncbi:MAG TPA: fatty acid desaturase [Candidatus Hydrogenedentes bacterium]|nr:fatty acid desaturase [Candidatus Hydrogenedentota bacterium]